MPRLAHTGHQARWRCRLALRAHRRAQAPAPDADAGLSLAWGLPDSESFEAAIGRGYDGASGWFFMRSKAARKALAPSHAQIVRLMNLVRNNADIREIETVLKQDVALSYKLLRHINSVGFGLMCEIQSFRHAVSILGCNKLPQVALGAARHRKS